MRYSPLLLITLLFCCFNCAEEQKLTLEDVIAKHSEKAQSINKISYEVRRVDTFAQGGEVWDNKGFAHLEKRLSDSIFGFSFYGKREDVPVICIYDNGKSFTLDEEEMVYELEKGAYYYVGSPGGQMVSSSFFSLDSVYQSSELIKSDNGYTIKYTFPDDTTYMVTNRVKLVALNEDFIPIRVKSSSISQGEKSSTDLYFSNIKLNEETKGSINDYKDLIKDYTLMEPEEDVPSSLLGKALPVTTFKDLKTGENISVDQSKIVLLDFWEVWCGWCIKAFPDVENLQNNYQDELLVLGISTEDKEKAIKMIDKKKVTFLNAFESNTLHDVFEVQSFPKYYLVDTKGIIVNEYFGFSEDIEKDIIDLINQ